MKDISLICAVLTLISTLIIGALTIFLTIHYNRKILKRDEIDKNNQELRHFEYSIRPLAINFINKYNINKEILTLCNVADKITINYIKSFNNEMYNEFRVLPQEVKTYLYKYYLLDNYISEDIVSEEKLFLFLNKEIDLEKYMPIFSRDHIIYEKSNFSKPLNKDKINSYIDCYNKLHNENFNALIYVLFFIHLDKKDNYKIVKELVENYENKNCLNTKEDLYLLCLYEFYISLEK